MRKHICVGARVSARRGDFLAGEVGQRRKTREKWYGVVSDSIGAGLWVVTWDNDRTTSEKSSQLQLHLEGAGRQPLLDLSPVSNTAARPPRNEDEDLIERPAGSEGVVLLPTVPMPPLPTTSLQGSNEGVVRDLQA